MLHTLAHVSFRQSSEIGYYHLSPFDKDYNIPTRLNGFLKFTQLTWNKVGTENQVSTFKPNFMWYRVIIRDDGDGGYVTARFKSVCLEV